MVSRIRHNNGNNVNYKGLQLWDHNCYFSVGPVKGCNSAIRSNSRSWALARTTLDLVPIILLSKKSKERGSSAHHTICMYWLPRGRSSSKYPLESNQWRVWCGLGYFNDGLRLMSRKLTWPVDVMSNSYYTSVDLNHQAHSYFITPTRIGDTLKNLSHNTVHRKKKQVFRYYCLGFYSTDDKTIRCADLPLFGIRLSEDNFGKHTSFWDIPSPTSGQHYLPYWNVTSQTEGTWHFLISYNHPIFGHLLRKATRLHDQCLFTSVSEVKV